jgi:hypothetical protein
MPDYAKPITNYTPPKSDAPETIAWLANWLNNRRSQLYNNLGGFLIIERLPFFIIQS